MSSPVLATLALALAVAVVRSLSAPLNDTKFAVAVSSRLKGGEQETLCAHIQNAAQPVSLSVSLETDSSSALVLMEDVQQDFYRCMNFQVPLTPSRTVASVNVTVSRGGQTLTKSSKVLIEPPAFIHLIQTDKPIYKPGQTVQFRIVSTDIDFIPVKRVYTLVELLDPSGNRIAQWLDQVVVGGILDLKHPMIPEAEQGRYTIGARTDKEEKIQHSFELKEYVLPKYEVKVLLPPVISILDREATFSVCGKYTYGKPVLGSAKAVVCRKAFSFYWISSEKQPDLCQTFQLTTDKSGCASQTINVGGFAPNKHTYVDRFEVSAELEESGTGVVLTGAGQTSFSSQVRAVTFKDTPESYRPGLPFQGKVRMVGPDGKPVAGEPVYVSAGDSQSQTLTTDAKGTATFSFDTALWTGTLTLQARSRKEEREPYVPDLRQPEYRSTTLRVAAFYSKSRSFLKLLQANGRLPCNKEAAVKVQYLLQGEELKGQEQLDCFYLVTSKGRIVQHGRVLVAVKAGIVNTGEISVPLRQVGSLAPVAQVVVYAEMPGGEVVADSQDYPVQLCLNNKVSLKFSSPQELPAEKTTLSLKAHPGSVCSVRAVDQSVLLLQAEEELSVASVTVPSVPAPPGAFARNDPQRPPEERLFFFSHQEIGMKFVTNGDVKKPYDCLERFPIYAFYDADMVDAPVPLAFNTMVERGEVLRKDEQKKETLRTFFPETWIWDLVSVGDAGSVDLDKTVPDTITKWAAGAFCVSSAGLGVAPGAALTAFQPFFVSLTLPYSVVRGEVFPLRATVFNYLSDCIMVQLTLAESDQYAFRSCDGCRYTACLCGEESATFTWIVTPAALGIPVKLKVSAEALKTDVLCGNEVATVPKTGQIDTVVRTLLVEAEGTPEMVSHNALLCPAEGPKEKKVSLLLPEFFVAGSARASVSVLGDLMGRAMKNLDQLLAMPYGCGEQNMVLFAPNIFILNYLQSTGQLTPDIREKATRFLESGYQRELTYKHDDGSYSAFGKSDPSGNTWLTAFVMKSFGGARPFIFVDPKHIKDARRWLAEHQRPDGCIRSVGKLFHNGMKGGVSDDVSLTAYVAAAMLELEADLEEPVVQKCLECLRAAVSGQLDNLYTSALLSYTFTLAKDEETRSKLLADLHQKSSDNGGTRHWDRAGASGRGLDSLEVEMTSYVLLALLSGPALPGFGLDYASGIVRWLARQQNPYGGFSSTQDTVVALQALAKYGAATYSPEGSTTVTVTSLGGLRKEFTVDQSNRLLYQEEKLSEVPGEYAIRAEGRSCVLAQISAHYNVPPPPGFSAFNVTASTTAKCGARRPQLLLVLDVGYRGRREETNMVIVNVKLLSGYVLEPSSLDLLKRDTSVKRVDLEDGYVNVYLDGLKKAETKTYSLTLEEELPVRNLKPAVVKVYDYYQTGDVAATEYSSPCSEGESRG
uniref:Alpha-2-macroglobulin bait region domain-containing protein n=1 Tax=Tetraodon nigroviridis TaxID=99883 RepID=H3DA42_TETNG